MMRLGQATNIPDTRAEVHESLYALSKWLKSKPTIPMRITITIVSKIILSILQKFNP